MKAKQLEELDGLAASDPAARQLAIARNAMPVLVARLGGEVAITEQEFDDLASRYGRHGVTAEWSASTRTLRLTLVPLPTEQAPS